MRIAFETKNVRDLCLKAETAAQQFGEQTANSLFAMLADIKAAENANELFLAERVEGDEVGAERLKLFLGESKWLEMVSNHSDHNGPTATKVTWAEVKRVRILGVFKHVS